MDKKLAFQLLDVVSSILLKYDIKSFLIGGTLLGVIRDNDFIEHDNDVDLAITYDLFSNPKKLLVFIKDLDDNNLRCGSLWDFHQLSILDKNIKKLHLDLVYCKKENDYYKFTYNSGYHKYPEVYFNTLKQIKFKNKSFYVPNKSEELLRLQFGENWETPIENKKTNDIIDTRKKPIKTFNFPLMIPDFGNDDNDL